MAKYVILDTETTGANSEDRIIQLGYLVLGKPSDPIEVYNEFCKPDVAIKVDAMEVHGITPEMIAHAPAIEQTAAYQTLQTLNDAQNYLLIHNAPFDLGMLEKEGFSNKMQLIDTLQCAKHLYPDSPKHRLQYFRYSLGLYQQEAAEAQKLGVEVKAHDAIGDVLVLKLLVSQLTQEVRKQFGKVDVMQKLVELTMMPVEIKYFRFGKYKGELIREVAQTDRGYLDWMLNNMTDLQPDMKYTLETVLSE